MPSFVEASIFDEMVEGRAAFASEAKVGPGLDPESEFGPVISEEQFGRVSGYIDLGLEEGAEVRLVLSFPGLLRALPISGRVKWIRQEPPEQRGVGIAFDKDDAESRERIAELVQRIAAGDPSLMQRTLRVLVVEDNPHVARLIIDGLASKQASFWKSQH